MTRLTRSMGLVPLAAAAATMTLAGCVTTTPAKFERRVRQFDEGDYTDHKPANTRGSLFANRSSLFRDERARGVGDVVIVRIEEKDSALHDSSTKLGRDAKIDLGISGAVTKLAPDAGLTDLFGYEQGNEMSGQGRVERRQEIRGQVPVRVKKVLPNGDFYVEGTKVVSISDERRFLYVSGVVRPADILQDGSVLSTRLADADIIYQTEGNAADQQRPGWLARVMSMVWPF